MSRAWLALVVALALGGCPSFHPEPLSGAPADATFVDVDGVHVRYRETGSGPAVVLITAMVRRSTAGAAWLPRSPRTTA